MLLAILMVKSSGSRRGLELMPWPDGLEYAASAVNLAAGRGAVLHFGGYTYPSRYTGGYPLILEFFYRSNGTDFRPLYAGGLSLAIACRTGASYGVDGAFATGADARDQSAKCFVVRTRRKPLLDRKRSENRTSGTN